MKKLQDYIAEVLAEGQPTPQQQLPRNAQELLKQVTGQDPPDEAQQVQDREGLERDDEVAVDKDPRYQGKPMTFVAKAGNTATVRDPDGKTASVPFNKVMMVRKAADAQKAAQQQAKFQQTQQQAQQAQQKKAATPPQKPQGTQGTQGTQGSQGFGESRELARLRFLAGLPPTD